MAAASKLERKYSTRYPVEEKDGEGEDRLTPCADQRANMDFRPPISSHLTGGADSDASTAPQRPLIRATASDKSAELSSLSGECAQPSPFSADFKLGKPIMYLPDEHGDTSEDGC